jgi:hypothetical protein
MLPTKPNNKLREMPPNLYSYCILQDNGSAPNPFWGVCTLAICKPKIRKTIQIGDWIVGTGSSKYSLENQMVYAMEVTLKMSFKEYDDYCRKQLTAKIPVKGLTKDIRKKVGDCLYDYSTGKIVMRDWGPHQLENMQRDLSGEFVLLSDNFYYFGSKPIPLPAHLLKIVKQGQGHKSKSNAPYAEKFVEWITSFKKLKNKVNSKPYGLELFEKEEYKSTCGKLHLANDEEDEKIIDE